MASTTASNDYSSGGCRLNTANIIDRRRFVALATTVGIAPAVGRAAFAEAWPSRPVRIVVPYAPGGSTDTVARITADRLSSIWAQQLVIENQPASLPLAALRHQRSRTGYPGVHVSSLDVGA